MTTSKGLVKLKNTSYVLNPSGFIFPNKRLNSIAIDGLNEIWFDYKPKYTSPAFQKLGSFDGVSTSTIFQLPFLESTSFSTRYYSFAFDNYDTLWGCWSGSLYSGWFKFKDNHFEYGNIPQSFGSDIYFIDAAVDQMNNKWFATSKGIAKFNGRVWELFNSSNTSLPEGRYTKIKFDKYNRLWAIVNNTIVKNESGDWKVYNGFNEENIQTFCIDSDDIFWIGTNSYVYEFDGQKVLRKFFIQLSKVMIADAQNNIWIGTENGIYKLNKNGLE